MKITSQILVEPEVLHQHLGDPGWRVVDCRFMLSLPEAGRENYLQGHIPGASYTHLNQDLSGLVIPGKTGRHPLPEVDKAAAAFSRLGIGTGIQVVAYDDAGGALAASRLWWLLRWLGHLSVSVLDGGWRSWLEAGLPVETGPRLPDVADFSPHPQPGFFVTSQEVEKFFLDPAYCLLDARSVDRYHGLNETIDPVAGHIPGAVSAPYQDNLDSSGRFKTQAVLRERYRLLLGSHSPDQTIVYCGSGVTAAHNILAMEYAGLTEARLYAGSWSEWIIDPKRPVDH
jgi:thiosulfate/3-mercaptopyruvate sulfurtransferase